MEVVTTPFGKQSDGQEIHLYTCTNDNGLVVSLIDYGAIVVRVETPDRDGKSANINLGFPSIDGYLGQHPFFGTTVGRYCNRIAKGRFTLEGREYQLAVNNGPNHLHGGLRGFDKAIWKAEVIETSNEVGVRFRHRSNDGDEGYPGTLNVTATYLLTDANELRVEFEARTDRTTVVNLTNHNYWNLAGAGSGTVLDHALTLSADDYLPVDDTLIPKGVLASVTGTPMDFRETRPIGSRMSELVAEPPGYDHCFVVRGTPGTLRRAARVRHAGSGRVLEVETTQPGIQLYTANFLSGKAADGGFARHAGFCLETQHYPDSPNQPAFPSTILRPGETFHETTVHRFRVE
ncbi:MAG: galactose mutarotase [Planctomycetes bacterium]|nr:galactose mutarotase [Planctomycetota bacterium]